MVSLCVWWRRNRRRASFLFFGAIGVTGCAAGHPQVESLDLRSPEPVTLEVGDVVEVRIWREEDLSGRFRVDENGVVTLPLLGERRVTGIPIDRLREDLTRAYRTELRNPAIEVTPLRQVLVLGAVNQPGPYEVMPITSVLGVIAAAGGATSAGDLNRIQIARDGVILADRVAPGATLVALNLRSGDQIIVANKNWFLRNQSFVVSVLLAIPSVIYTITRIGR